MKKLLMLTDLDGGDILSGDFAGLSLRVWSLAKIFSKSSKVTIGLSSNGKSFQKSGITCTPIPKHFDWGRVCQEYDLVYILQSSSFQSVGYRFARRKLPLPTIVDCYTPLLFEKLTYAANSADPDLRILEASEASAVIMRRGSLFLCASRPQADYLLGVISTMRIGWDPEIICIRNGELEPRPVKKSWNNQVVWFGGVYPWMDIAPVFESMKEVMTSPLQVKFDVIGPAYKKRLGFEDRWERIKEKLVHESKRNVRILDWIPFKDVPSILRRYSLAISWSKRFPEDRLAYRSRIISVLNSGTPVITNGDDEISNLIDFYHAGMKLEKPSQLAPAVISLISDKRKLQEMSENIGNIFSYLSKQNQLAEARLLDLIEDLPVPASSAEPELSSIKLFVKKFFYSLRG